MAIELSSLTFTEQDDVVPASGEEQIFNSGITNTLAGNDLINGTDSYYGNVGLENYSGVINTGDGDDTLIGSSYWSNGIVNSGTINTGVGKDKIAGYGGIYNSFFSAIETGADDDEITASGNGIYNDSIIDTGDGHDIITASGNDDGIDNNGIINTGDGHDIITGDSTAEYDPRFHFPIGGGISNRWGSIIDTGNGNDRITGTGNNSIKNDGSINTGNGEDSIISEGEFNNSGSINIGSGEDFIETHGGFNNYGGVLLGDGDDSIFSSSPTPDSPLQNFNFIGTGDGNDIITTGGVLYNQGVIETGKGNDSIIVYGNNGGGFLPLYSIYNNGGSINTGDGNDSIIAHSGFRSGENSSGAWFLGDGEDYIRGFGSGDFYGGNGNDTLELMSGTYTVGIWGEGGESPILTQGDQLMITSEFEKLKAGSTIYDFTSLTAGQIIVVA